MANLKVIVACSVSFFGLLWLFLWKKSPKQKPPSDSKEKQTEDKKLPSVGSKNNLPDVVHQSTESVSPGIQQEDVLEKVLSNIEESVPTKSCKLDESSEAQHPDQDRECVEEQIIQEEVLTSSSCAVVQSGNKTMDISEYDMNCNGDNTRFSTSEYNSTQIAGSEDNLHRNSSAMNEAFMTTDIGDGIMNKTCEKPIDSTHDVSLSTSTFAEPLLESTKLDITSCENEQSMKIECSVPLSTENNITHNNKLVNGGDQYGDNDKDKNDSLKNNHVSEFDSIVNHVNSNHDQMTSSWSSEVESCDNLDKQTDIDLSGGDNSNQVHTKDSVSETPSKTDSEVSAHGSDSNTSNCDSVSSNCSSRASSIVEAPNKSNRSKKETYEFNFPTQFCGRLIGKYGKNIQQLKERSGANISLSNHPFTPDFQLCLIEGTQRQIDEALKVIGRKFPEVDLTAIGAEIETEPEPSTNGKPMLMPDIMQLNLPEGVSIDVVVSSIVDAGHVFVQQHTHPSFPSLERLNQFMIACYTQDGIVPQLPRPLEVGVICSAPMLNGWYRAQITAVYDDTDECDIKYVDYGGFSRVPGCTLRQIRSDFMTLPFQAVECYMANITPIQDEEYFSSEAAATLEELTQGKLLQAQIVGRHEDGTPYIHIYQIAGEKVLFVNRELVNRGVTRWMELMS